MRAQVCCQCRLAGPAGTEADVICRPRDSPKNHPREAGRPGRLLAGDVVPGASPGLEYGAEFAEVLAVGVPDGGGHQGGREPGESGRLAAVLQRHPG